VWFCKVEARLWLKHRVVHVLRKGIVRLRASRREVVVHLQHGHWTCLDAPDVLDVDMGQLPRVSDLYRGKAIIARSWPSTWILPNAVLSWFTAVDFDVLAKGVAVVGEGANVVCVRREYFAAIFAGWRTVRSWLSGVYFGERCSIRLVQRQILTTPVRTFCERQNVSLV
jgi:hypothetical protein